MDVGVLVYFVLLLAGGTALGAALAYCRPQDEEAATAYRGARVRAAAWLRNG